jgi:hypothetical protein
VYIFLIKTPIKPDKAHCACTISHFLATLNDLIIIDKRKKGNCILAKKDDFIFEGIPPP